MWRPCASAAEGDRAPLPLPPASRGALAWAGAVALAALAVPVVLGVRDGGADFMHALAPGGAYWSHVEMVALCAAFALLHSGGAALRPLVVRVTGERVYRVAFALTSIPAAVGLIAFFIAHRYDGAQLWALQGVPGVREACWITTFVSFLLLYPATFNLLEVAAIRKPGFRMYETGVARITRHPQLWGQVLWCVAHTAWMGSSLTLTASLALVAHHLFGVWNGDRRQRDAFGEEFVLFAARTSVVPFAAVADGRQSIVLSEFLRPAYAGVIAFVVGTYAAHPAMLRLVGNLHW